MIKAWIVSDKIFDLILISIITLAVLGYRINEPFYGPHAQNAVDYSTHARNHLALGLTRTKLGMVQNPAYLDPKESNLNYYTHHPALYPLLLTLVYRVLGVSEWSTRMLSILFSMGSVIGIYLIVGKFGERGLAIAASLGLLLTPMMAYFGKLPAHEPLLLALIIWLGWLFLQWVEGKRTFIPIVLLTLVIGLIGWPGYLAIPASSFYTFIWKREKFWTTFWLWLVLIFTFGLHLLHLFWLTGSLGGGQLFETFLFRLNWRDNPNQYLAELSQQIEFSWFNYLRILLNRWVRFFGIGLVFLSGGWWFVLGWKLIRRISLTKIDKASGFFLGTALLYPMIFANASLIHNYLSIYFLPFITISAIAALKQLIEYLKLSGYGKFLLISIVLAINGAYGLGFWQTLYKSRPFQNGYNLGSEIRSLAPNLTPVIVSNAKFGELQQRFIDYYADRKVEYVVYSDQELAEGNLDIKKYEGENRLVIVVR